jgi:hypothetical protein
MDKFGSQIDTTSDPTEKKRGTFEVLIKPGYTGPRRLACWLFKAKEAGKMSRMFGKWNKRYFILDLDEVKMYYTSKPGGKDVKYLVLNVSSLC